MKNLKIPIGIEDFLEANNYYYVDKTLMIDYLLKYAINKSLLITRPRRFGKSLALSMVDYFFNIRRDCSDCFNNKKIMDVKEASDFLNQYPVIHLNMKNMSAPNYDSMVKETIDQISSIFIEYSDVMDSIRFDIQKEKFNDIINQRYENYFDYTSSILFLSDILYKHYGKKVVILIDEYDTPLDNAFHNGFYDKAIEFYKRLYSSTLKANNNVLFAITTGVLQIAKESIFSEMNNLDTYSVIDDELQEYFGFTNDEIKKIIEDFNLNVTFEDLKEYYGGYGNETINLFNPWSVLNYIKNNRFDTYWANSGANNLINDIISQIPNGISVINEYVNNNNKPFIFNNSISYRDIFYTKEIVFSLLIQSGYLVTRRLSDDYYLLLPNKELKYVFEREIILRNKNKDNLRVGYLLREAILDKNTEVISKILEEYILESFSYYDLRDEKDYQTMLSSLMAILFTDYIVKNEEPNRHGRCDIMVKPKNNNDIGIVIEIKNYKGYIGSNRLKNNADHAIKQIKEHKYYQDLIRDGCQSILLYGFAFDKSNHSISVEQLKNNC